MAVERDYIVDLDGVLVPSAVAGEHRRAARFANPLFVFAFVILHVQGDLHVGIDKLKIRYGSLDRHRLVRVVIGLSVMRQKRGGNKTNAKYRGQKKCELLHS